MIESRCCRMQQSPVYSHADDDLTGPVLKERERSMNQAHKVVIERDTQGGYVATFPGLMGRQAQARSLKTLMDCIREAMALSLEVDEPAAVPREDGQRLD
jgi:predicted RNase H-like HicB family nuclease